MPRNPGINLISDLLKASFVIKFQGCGPNIIVYELNQHCIPSGLESYFSLENISWVYIIERVYIKVSRRDWQDKKRKLENISLF